MSVPDNKKVELVSESHPTDRQEPPDSGNGTAPELLAAELGTEISMLDGAISEPPEIDAHRRGPDRSPGDETANWSQPE